MDFTTRTITTGDGNDQTFVYADSGTGPLVVLFHGFPDLPTGWADTAAALNAAGYRTVLPYLRGYHPDTIVPGRRYRGTEIGEDAIRLLDALDAENAVLVGHDWGATAVYHAAAAAPERVRKLIAVAIAHPNTLRPTPALLLGARHFVTLALPSRALVSKRADFAYIDTLMRRWAPNWSGPARDASLAAVKRAFDDERVLDGALQYYAQYRPAGMTTLSPPALLVGGTTDIVPVRAFAQSRSWFSGTVEVFIAAGAGHWPHREAAAPFHQRLLAFLRA
jgi:pimeloyl-ACP methyl ester carboxylesterase